MLLHKHQLLVPKVCSQFFAKKATNVQYAILQLPLQAPSPLQSWRSQAMGNIISMANVRR